MAARSVFVETVDHGVVRHPMTTDALSAGLRDAFAPPQRLPADMIHLLAVLDEVKQGH